jgi:nicotinamidase-related amidase
MTTLSNRPNTALAVIDVQVGVVADAHDRDRVVGNIATLVARAREHGTPVVWVLHSHPEYLPKESDQWQLVPELTIADGERVVHKTYADSFEETDLEASLADLGVGRIVVSGAQTDECIRSTLHGALVRGYDAVLVSDAHTTEDQSAYGAPTPDLVIAHTNLYWTYHRAPGREAGTVSTAEVDFTSRAAAS